MMRAPSAWVDIERESTRLLETLLERYGGDLGAAFVSLSRRVPQTLVETAEFQRQVAAELRRRRHQHA